MPQSYAVEYPGNYSLYFPISLARMSRANYLDFPEFAKKLSLDYFTEA